MSLENTISAAPALEQFFSHIRDGENIALSSLREQASYALSDFARRASKQLRALGIATPPAINLVSTANHLRSNNAHPDADRINTWLQGNDYIVWQFKEVEVLYELVRATENVGHATVDDSLGFHIGLTSAGPIAYFGRTVHPH